MERGGGVTMYIPVTLNIHNNHGGFLITNIILQIAYESSLLYVHVFNLFFINSSLKLALRLGCPKNVQCRKMVYKNICQGMQNSIYILSEKS